MLLFYFIAPLIHAMFCLLLFFSPLSLHKLQEGERGERREKKQGNKKRRS
jgi:hypothetical protein